MENIQPQEPKKLRWAWNTSYIFTVLFVLTGLMLIVLKLAMASQT